MFHLICQGLDMLMLRRVRNKEELILTDYFLRIMIKTKNVILENNVWYDTALPSKNVKITNYFTSTSKLLASSHANHMLKLVFGSNPLRLIFVKLSKSF